MGTGIWAGYVGINLLDLSKSYGYLSHDLLIAKLEAYRSDIGSLNTLLDYLKLKEHRTKVGLIHCQKTYTILIPTLKAKYGKRSSIIAIVCRFTKECFSFNKITVEHAVEEISI